MTISLLCIGSKVNNITPKARGLGKSFRVLA